MHNSCFNVGRSRVRLLRLCNDFHLNGLPNLANFYLSAPYLYFFEFLVFLWSWFASLWVLHHLPNLVCFPVESSELPIDFWGLICRAFSSCLLQISEIYHRQRYIVACSICGSRIVLVEFGDILELDTHAHCNLHCSTAPCNLSNE